MVTGDDIILLQLKFNRADLILIVVIVFIATLFLFGRWLNNESHSKEADHYYATITIDNEVYKTVELTAETQYIEVRTENGYDILKIHNYGIEVIESDCPQKICFTFGFITQPNESIICLPLRMIIEINGGSNDTDDEIDAVVN